MYYGPTDGYLCMQSTEHFEDEYIKVLDTAF